MIKKIFLLLILTTFLMGSFCFAQRELEIKYPELEVPGVETPTTTRTVLTEFVRYVFTFAIAIAGLLAFGALIYGGIRYLTSAGDPTKMSDGKNQVMAGFLGLIILLSSYLILNTINPQLVLKETPAIESLEKGIYAYVKAGCVDDPDDFLDDPVSISQDSPDLSIVLPRDANGVPQSLQCIQFRSGEEELTVKVCSDTNFGEPCTLYEGEVGETKNVTGESIKLDYHLPGVYLYASENCTGDDYKIYQSSSATLPEFDNKTNSIKFIYDDKNPDTGEYEIKYAAILHEKENFMGRAAIFDQDQNVCLNLGDVSSALGNSSKSYSSNLIGISSCEAAPGCDTNCNECGSQAECEASPVYCRWTDWAGCFSFPEECDEDCSKCSTPQYCDWSKANCYWDESGFWAECVSFAECDQDCSKCEIKEACENSSADCQWDWFNEECKSVAGCDTDCSKCGTQSACRDSPAYCYWNGSECEIMPPECDANCSKCIDAGTCSFSKANCQWDILHSKCVESSGPGCDTDCSKCNRKTDCEASSVGCYWYASQCLTFPSGCDTDCSKCTDFSSCGVSEAVCLWDASKAKCEPMPSGCDSDCSKCTFKEACEESSANCTWRWWAGGNKCEAITGCDTNCSNCTNKNTCEASPASCSWDSLKNECRATAPPPPPAPPEGHGYGADLSGTVSSITVYLKPIDLPTTGGVRFWEDKNYTKKYLRDDVNQDGFYGDNESETNLDTNLRVVEVKVTDSTTTETPLTEKFNDKASSMEMDGHYVVLLFRDPNYQGDCEVFMASCPDFRSHRIGQCGWLGRSDCLSSFIIKARK